MKISVKPVLLFKPRRSNFVSVPLLIEEVGSRGPSVGVRGDPTVIVAGTPEDEEEEYDEEEEEEEDVRPVTVRGVLVGRGGGSTRQQQQAGNSLVR